MYRVTTDSTQFISNVFVCFFVLFLSQRAFSDWINLTGAETSPNIAEITVNDDHIELKLEIYINDLKHYNELIPSHLLKEPTQQRKNEAERMVIFAKNKFSMITDDGEYLPAQLKLVEPRIRQERFSAFAGMINLQINEYSMLRSSTLSLIKIPLQNLRQLPLSHLLMKKVFQ